MNEVSGEVKMGEEVEDKRSGRGYSWGLMGADDNSPAV